MLFADLVATSSSVPATRSRTAKVAALAELLRGLATDEIAPAVGFLTGTPRQGRIGIGWAAVTAVDVPSSETDELLAWQTERLQALAISSEGHVVPVRPELVVEIAIDGVQESARYPGGIALRFARVRRYREDKSPADADTIDSVRAMFG